jgi:hypothetical protein
MKKTLKHIKLLGKVIIILLIIQISLLILSLSIHSQIGAGDCPGLCVTSGGTYTAVNGSVAELNVVNDGCLTALEATSSFWYQVCFTSNGIFYFNINPQGNNNDFDFAVWNGSNCPPTNNPIRCSWAGIFPFGGASNDLTGLGNGAIDNNEGAGGNGWVAPINVTNGQCLTININNYGNGSNNFTLYFTGTTATMYCPTPPLAVSLGIFEGFYEDGVINLNWNTLSETNSDYFIIEKMTNIQEIREISKIYTSGNSNSQLQYSFTDFDVNYGENYYRLVEYSINGESKIYDWILITVDDSEDYCCVRYYDLQGKLINKEDLQSGVYIGITKNNKVIKIKR